MFMFIILIKRIHVDISTIVENGKYIESKALIDNKNSPSRSSCSLERPFKLQACPQN